VCVNRAIYNAVGQRHKDFERSRTTSAGASGRYARNTYWNKDLPGKRPNKSSLDGSEWCH